MPSLDTNVLLRWLLDDAPTQSALADRLIDSPATFRIDDAVLIETVHVLQNVIHADREKVRNALRLVIAKKNFELDRGLWNDVASVYHSHPKLSVVDVYLTLRAQRAAAGPLLTFDRKLAAQLDGAELL